MTNTTAYSGWDSYQTWRVRLELFDGMLLNDLCDGKHDAFDLAKILSESADQMLDDHETAHNYARAFLDGVNWREIAESILEESAECEA